ncbi:CLIPD7 [Cordylochernes scorpioides]|uniref:CLIPD7 n=1 Tax=Cordylochernes scorpioides TaxID=51811 RepID=A0ABY6LE89_9ARAC|nr:CLIPD7 [Cordylochernes scorpioides]
MCGLPTEKPQSRIVGGRDAEYAEFPWQLVWTGSYPTTAQQCGGVLLSSYFVMTAAHCVYLVPLHEIKVVLGGYDLHNPRDYGDTQIRGVSRVTLHDKFQPQLHRPHGHHRPAGARLTPPYTTATAPYLQKATVPIVSNEKCETWHHTRGIRVNVHPDMLCAGYEGGETDACVGDSGGPLIVKHRGRWTVAGLISAGFGCAQTRQPGIYHRITTTSRWIYTHIY